MTTNLRDLDADRRFVDQVTRQLTPETDTLICIAAAAIDEIARLKRLLVWYDSKGKCFQARVTTFRYEPHKSEAAAWAAVRKWALK